MSVTVLTAMLEQLDRKTINQSLNERGVNLSRDRLDSTLKFLVQFGVLKEFAPGQYKMASSYLSKAINTREPESLLDSELAKGKVNEV